MPQTKHSVQIGEQFGLWTVTRGLFYKETQDGRRRIYCTCQCSCEAERDVDPRNLTTGKSLGCVDCRNGSTDKNPHFRHGMCDTKAYECWAAMKDRCRNPKCNGYPDYGGRGIEVAERWNDFNNFYADMGDPPTKEHSIERKDVNGHYEPENCVWETNAAQSRNRRNNRFLTYKDRTMCLADWAIELGMKFTTLQSRLDDYGWSVEDALSLPVARGTTRISRK